MGGVSAARQVFADLAPGEHSVSIEREGSAPKASRVQARYGQPVIVDVQLEKSDRRYRARGAGRRRRRNATGRAALHGLGRARRPLVAPRRLRRPRPPRRLARRRLRLLRPRARRARRRASGKADRTDTWGNAVGALAPTACTVPNDEFATAFSAFLAGELGYRVASRIRIDGDLGVGIASYFATQVGGDLFVPTCSVSTGLRPAFLFSASASYAFTGSLRAVVTPLAVELQPAFGGTRSGPLDASGLWLRLGGGIGLAVDL